MRRGQAVIGEPRHAPAQARRRGQVRGLQRGGHRGDAGGRNDQAVLFELEQRAARNPASDAIRPATPAPRPARRCAPNAPGARARGRKAAPHRRTAALRRRPRIASRRLRCAASTRPSVAARAASGGRSANRRCSTSEAQQRIEARVLDHGARPRAIEPQVVDVEQVGALAHEGFFEGAFRRRRPRAWPWPERQPASSST